MELFIIEVKIIVNVIVKMLVILVEDKLFNINSKDFLGRIKVIKSFVFKKIIINKSI